MVHKLQLFYLQVIPQGVAPTPCIPCCLVVTDRKLLTCHQDCQTSFFRSLGSVDICDITAVMVEANKQYCVIVSGPLIHLSLPLSSMWFNIRFCSMVALSGLVSIVGGLWVIVFSTKMIKLVSNFSAPFYLSLQAFLTKLRSTKYLNLEIQTGEILDLCRTPSLFAFSALCRSLHQIGLSSFLRGSCTSVGVERGIAYWRR